MQEAEWLRLVEHSEQAQSDLLLLPEMPFFPWIAAEKEYAAATWSQAVEAHEAWSARFADLGSTAVLASRPVASNHNEGFVWMSDSGDRAVHHKYYLPDEDGFWEAKWYQRGGSDFTAVDIGIAKVGFAICSELWFTEHARDYARQGIHLLACPRATERATLQKWIIGGSAAAVMAGAFCISSNRGGVGSGIEWGGHGWIIDPDGEVLGVTSGEDPFLTLDIDLQDAQAAKATYPRYLAE